MVGDGAAVASTILGEVEALGEEIAGFAAQVDAANCDLLIRLREFDELEGWAHLGFRSCAHWLSWRTGMAPATARQRVRVARDLGKLPGVERAMKAGEISYSKVRAIVRVATAETERDYLDLAKHCTAGQLERISAACSKSAPEEHDDRPQRFVRRRDLDGGLVRIEIQLPREDADVVWEAISRATAAPAPRSKSDSAESSDLASEAPAQPANDPPSTEERRADAVVTLAETSLQEPGRTRGSSFELLLVGTATDASSSDSLDVSFTDGAPLPSAAAYMIACDCAVVPTRADEAGHVLSIGRRSRVIPPHLHRALRLRDQGCAFPGCTADRHVDGHHIEHWADGGPTALDNLVHLCRYHHRAVHEGRIEVAMSRGRPVFSWPNRGSIPRVPRPATPKVRPWVICPEPRWEGDPLNLDAAVLSLVPGRDREAPSVRSIDDEA